MSAVLEWRLPSTDHDIKKSASRVVARLAGNASRLPTAEVQLLRSFGLFVYDRYTKYDSGHQTTMHVFQKTSETSAAGGERAVAL